MLADEAPQRWLRRFGHAEGPWMHGDPAERGAAYFTDGGVPVNLLGLTDPSQVADAEAIVTSSAALDMGLKGQPSTFDFAGLAEVHRALTGRLYAWAGEPRTVDLPGSVQYEHARWQDAPFFIDQLADNLQRSAAPLPHAELAAAYTAVLAASPFRAGNGEAARAYVAALATDRGEDLHWGRAPVHEHRRATEAALAGDPRQLRSLFVDRLLDPAAPLVHPDRRPTLADPLAIAFPPLPGTPGPQGPAPPTPDPTRRPQLRLVHDSGHSRH